MDNQQQGNSQRQPIIWYCPTRWLMAHYDPQADINTMSSHMCLADLNNDGENLLALVDFKRLPLVVATRQPKTRSHAPYDCRLRVYRGHQLIYNHFLDDMPSSLLVTSTKSPPIPSRPQLPSMGNHRLINIQQAKQQQQQQAQVHRSQNRCLLTLTINDDVYFYHKLKPSQRISLDDDECILESLDRSEVDTWQMVRQNKVDIETLHQLLSSLCNELGAQALTSHSNNFLSLATNEERKNYLATWKLKRLGHSQSRHHHKHNHNHSSNSNNVNNATTSDLNDSGGHLSEHLMSMDTITCSAARLNYNSQITRSGDFGGSRGEQASLLIGPNAAKWNKILDIQRDGLILGTEDRHLLVFELRATRCRLECHWRLPATPDFILCERKSPSSFDLKSSGNLNSNLEQLTYKILISCRNCRIYSMDQFYVCNDVKTNTQLVQPIELVTLKCNVIEMCWCEADSGDMSSTSTIINGKSQPNFLVATLDRKVYCFNSFKGECKWLVETEMPITCMVGLPRLKQANNQQDVCLVGIASQSNRIDFHLSATGRIVDSMYFNVNDYCQAMTFGRFGREDNCLCLVTKLGSLLIFILKRTAKFAHGQCLSSAASYAADILALNIATNRQSSPYDQMPLFDHQVSSAAGSNTANEKNTSMIKLNEPVGVPSGFSLSKATTSGGANLGKNGNELDGASGNSSDLIYHDCNNEKGDPQQQQQQVVAQVSNKDTLLQSLLEKEQAQLQIPVKSRDFVDKIVEQSRQSTENLLRTHLNAMRAAISKTFAGHLVELREKIKSTLEQQTDSSGSNLGAASAIGAGNRISIRKIIGLGNTYRVSLSLRLNLRRSISSLQRQIGQQHRRPWKHHHLLSSATHKLERQREIEERSDVNSIDSNAKQPGKFLFLVSIFVFLDTELQFAALNQGQKMSQTKRRLAAATNTISVISGDGATGSVRPAKCQLRPSSFQFPFQCELPAQQSGENHTQIDSSLIVEKTIELKLITKTQEQANSMDARQQSLSSGESSVGLEVYALVSAECDPFSTSGIRTNGNGKSISEFTCKPIGGNNGGQQMSYGQRERKQQPQAQRLVFISSINIPTC